VNAITIRLSDQTLARIKELAALHRRTLEEEAAAILERAVQERFAPTEARPLLEKIAAMTPKDVPQTDCVDLLREDRGR
jgi:plasmid stability protein